MRAIYLFFLAIQVAVPAFAQMAAPSATLKLEVPARFFRSDMDSLSLTRTAVWSPPALAVPVQYGRGFDSATGELLSTACVGVASLEAKAGPIVSPTAENIFHESTSQEGTRADMKTGASASLLYEGFSASVGGSVLNGNFHNSFGRYVTAHREIVVNEFVSRGYGPNGDFRLTDAAAKLLDKGPATFRAACGDHFISGYKLGGVFNVVAAVRTNLDSNYKANETNVGIGFAGIFGADFSQSTGYGNMRSSSQFDVRDASSGVIFPAVSLETLKASYDAYESLVKANPGLLTFVFTPYATLPGKAASVPNFTALVAVKMEELARKRDRAKTQSSDLVVASNSVGLGFDYFVISGDAEAARKELDDYFASIAKAVDACRRGAVPNACVAAIDGVPTVPQNRVSRKP